MVLYFDICTFAWKKMLCRPLTTHVHYFTLLSALGSSNDFPGESCREIKQRLNTSISKEYWIKPTNTATAFLVYCEMKKEGGGWTLVYSYTFTYYKDFYNEKNAVTPRPNWNAPSANVTFSTSPPSRDKFGAIQFHLWKEIGEEFFIT